jgi:hypothetical protein
MEDSDIPRENPFASPTGQSKDKEEKIVIIQQYQQVQQQTPLTPFTLIDCVCLVFIGRVLCKVFCPCVSSVTVRL